MKWLKGSGPFQVYFSFITFLSSNALMEFDKKKSLVSSNYHTIPQLNTKKIIEQYQADFIGAQCTMD